MKPIKIPFTNKVIVDKNYLQSLERLDKDTILFCNAVILSNKDFQFDILELYDKYVVCVVDNNKSLPIKVFPFGDDKEYARLCAEELCEILNSKM